MNFDFTFGINGEKTDTNMNNVASGFGAAATTSPFAAKPAFGAAATTTPGNGLFGAATTTAPTAGFGGGFGNNPTTTGAFGAATPAATTTGGGIFGNKPGFGGATTSAGTSGTLFGTAGATSTTAFGAQNNVIGGGFGAATTSQAPITGTTNPPFTPFQEKDPASSTTNHFQTITFMPAYQKFSLEVCPFLYLNPPHLSII